MYPFLKTISIEMNVEHLQTFLAASAFAGVIVVLVFVGVFICSKLSDSVSEDSTEKLNRADRKFLLTTLAWIVLLTIVVILSLALFAI